MKLGVIVLNWNAAIDTISCVRTVQTWQPVLAPAIWVVDNASDEPVGSALAGDPAVRLVRSPANRGFAGGNNLGIAAALETGSDALLLLNNDATVDVASVASMLATLASDPRIGVVGPTLWDGGVLISAGGRDIARYAASHLRPARPPSTVFDVDYVPGTVALVARRVFETVGLLDEDYFFGGEMADLCERARRHGFRCVIDPRARARHRLARSSAARQTLHAYYVFRNRFLYVRKHRPARKTRLFALWILRGAVATAAALARGDTRRARAVGLGVLDGLFGRVGGQNARALGGSIPATGARRGDTERR